MGLVLKLNEGEIVVIGEVCKVRIFNIENGSAKLHFDCPKEINIVRKEVLDRETNKGESK